MERYGRAGCLRLGCLAEPGCAPRFDAPPILARVAGTSGSVLVAHSFSYLTMGRSARDDARKAVAENPQAWPSKTIIAILISALAAEAFINELGPLIDADARHWDEERLPEKVALVDLAAVLDEVEMGHGTTGLKYQMAAKTLTGRTFDLSTNPLQDFRELCKLRNLLAHLRPGDMLDEEGNVVPAEKVTVAFQQRGLTHNRPPRRRAAQTPGISWLNELQTDRMAQWAYETACAIIGAVIDMLPVTAPPLFGVTWLKGAIEPHLL
jgi:hypothetical protein